MADQGLEGSQPVDLKKHPSGIVPTLQWVSVFLVIASMWVCSFVTSYMGVLSCGMPVYMLISNKEVNWCCYPNPSDPDVWYKNATCKWQ